MKVIINPDKTLSIDGKKTFMVGMYAMCFERAEYKECNLADKQNYIMATARWQPTAVVKNTEGMLFTQGLQVTDDVLKNIIQYPNFFGFLLKDEPTDSELPLIQTEFGRAKSIAPTAPVILNHYTNLHKWYPYCDILSWDTYTIRWATGFGDDVNPMLYPREDAILAYESYCAMGAFSKIELNEIPKPVWAVIQAIGAEYTPDHIFVQTPEEQRANAFTAICMDVKGIEFWGYHIVPEPKFGGAVNYGLYVNPEAAEATSSLAGEIRNLNDILVAKTAGYGWLLHWDDIVTFTPNKTKKIAGRDVQQFSYILKDTGSAYYLIAVNKSNEPIIDVEITIAGIKEPAIAKVLGTEEKIIIEDGKMVDSFAGYGVNIYEIPHSAALGIGSVLLFGGAMYILFKLFSGKR